MILRQILRRGCPGLTHVDLTRKSMFLTDQALITIGKKYVF